MRSFYVPIYLSTNDLTEEKVCIAVILQQEQQLSIMYSEKKISWGLQYANTQSQGAIRRYLKRIEKTIAKINDDFSLLKPLSEPLQIEFYEALHLQKSNFIGWGKVCFLNQKMEHWNVERLARKILGEAPKVYEKSKTKKAGFRKKVHQIMSKRVFDIFEKNRIFHPDELSGIYTQHKIDLVLLSTSITGIQFIDFSVSVPTIEKNILQFARLARGLQIYAEESSINVNGFFIAYQSPRGQKQKAVLDRLLKDSNKSFDLIPMNEIQKAIKK